MTTTRLGVVCTAVGILVLILWSYIFFSLTEISPGSFIGMFYFGIGLLIAGAFLQNLGRGKEDQEDRRQLKKAATRFESLE